MKGGQVNVWVGVFQAQRRENTDGHVMNNCIFAAYILERYGKDMRKPKLYIKKENGRYEPYIEPQRPEHDNALYRRRGKKYEPVLMALECHSWHEGVFVVTKNHSMLQPDSWTSAEYLQEIFKLYKAGDIENVSIAKLGGMQKLANYLSRHWNEITGTNTYEKAASVVAILMNYEKETKK